MMEPRTKCYRVIFLEQHQEVFEAMHTILRAAIGPLEYRHLRSDNGILNDLHDFDPDVLIIGEHKPNINGLSVCSVLRNAEWIIPIILVTEVLSEEVALECINGALDDFVLHSNLKRLPSSLINALRKREIESEHQ